MDLPEMRKQLKDIALALSPHLPDWTIDTSRSMEDSGDRIQFCKDGMKFAIRWDWKTKTKLHVQTWEWPGYYKTGGRSYGDGTPQLERITPSSLYDPEEGSPSILFSADKTPAQMGADIKRRFLPEYERIFARCKERAESYQRHEDMAKSVWEQACAIIGQTPKHGVHYLNIPPFEDHPNCNGKLQNRNGSTVKLELDLLPDQVAAVLGALGWAKEK